MNVIIITDDSKNTDTLDECNNCNNDIIILDLFFTIPCGLSFLCLISLIVYTLVKPLVNKK